MPSNSHRMETLIPTVCCGASAPVPAIFLGQIDYVTPLLHYPKIFFGTNYPKKTLDIIWKTEALTGTY